MSAPDLPRELDAAIEQGKELIRELEAIRAKLAADSFPKRGDNFKVIAGGMNIQPDDPGPKGTA